jgi:F0F1-type ATP synthase assembly protein I
LPLLYKTLEDKPKKPFDNLVGGYATGYSLAIKFIFILACPIATGLGCGIWLDKQLNTTPWIMLVLVIASLIFSIYAVYRVAAQLQNK